MDKKLIHSHDFNKKLKLADRACLEVTEYLENKGFSVENVENDSYFQKIDVDILITKNGKTHKVEIKGDSYYPRNFYIEEISNINKNTPGCLLYTESDFIFYYYVNHKELYIIDTKAFQQWYKENKDVGKLQEIKSKVVTPVGKGKYYESYGRTLNVNILLEDLGKDIKKIKL